MSKTPSVSVIVTKVYADGLVDVIVTDATGGSRVLEMCEGDQIRVYTEGRQPKVTVELP